MGQLATIEQLDIYRTTCSTPAPIFILADQVCRAVAWVSKQVD
jgi:hypothetical protein